MKTLEGLGFKEYIIEDGRYYQNDIDDSTIYMIEGEVFFEYLYVSQETFNAIKLKMKELGWWK